MTAQTNQSTLDSGTSRLSARAAVSCTRKLQFCSGHRVMGHENKCAHMHGHNYEIHITAQAESLDNIGRIVDFSVLKEKIGSWIESEWDHGFVLWEKDKEAIEVMKKFMEGKQKLYILPENPTAENMAKYLLDKGNELLADTAVRVTKIIVWETANCYAEAELSG